MRNRILIAITTSLILFSFSATAGLTVYRGFDGEFSETSLDNLKTLRDIAKENGTVRVWVDFGIEFQPDPQLRTAEVIATEQLQKQQHIEEFVRPIIDNGNATEVAVDPFPVAPGIMLDINHKGLLKLAKNPNIKYIGQLDVTE